MINPGPVWGDRGEAQLTISYFLTQGCRVCSWRALETRREDRVPSEYKRADLQVCVHKSMSAHVHKHAGARSVQVQCAQGEEGGEEG